jgi:hypothetical protein
MYCNKLQCIPNPYSLVPIPNPYSQLNYNELQYIAMYSLVPILNDLTRYYV